jgi:hypothetical protein
MRRTIILFAAVALGGVLAFLVVALPALADPAALPPVTETDGRAGACYSFYHEGNERPYVQMAYDAGSRWDRFDFSWPTIEPSNNSWNFGPHDTLVNDLVAAKIKMVGILLWTPDWAATQGDLGLDARSFNQRPFGWYAPVPHDSALDQMPPSAYSSIAAASSPPQGLYLAWNDPNNYWGNYVYTVVSRYGDRVKHWEMWNEPDGYWNGYYPWTGTSADYARLLKVGYQATKAACLDCSVLFGGLQYWGPKYGFYRWVLSQLDADPEATANNHFFDVMSVHLYSRSSSIYDEVSNIRSGMSTYNVGDHPIWLTETGVPVWDDSSVDPDPSKYDYAATQDEAAAYVIQSYANAWAAGVERYFFFRTHDADMGEYFGLIRNDKSLRPSYTAYQVATTYLVEPRFVTRMTTNPFVRITLRGAPRGRVDVLWNDSPTTMVYALPAAVGSATLIDRWGNISEIVATDDVYLLTLSGATANLASNPGNYIVGGDPLIVVQAETLDEPPTSTVSLLPDLVYSTTFTVAWEGWDSESGVWAYDVQVRDGAGGEWEDWLQMTPSTSGQFTGEDDHTYYFRCRAIDKIGNREPWPDQPQAHTTVDLPKPLYFSATTFFADDDQDGVFSPTSEITLTQVTLRLLDASGQDAIPPMVGHALTATVKAEQPYTLWIEGGDYVRALSFNWPRSEEVYVETYSELGLWPVKRVYMPLVQK